MARRRAPDRTEALIVLGVLALVVGVGVGGWAFGHGTRKVVSVAATTTEAVPAGHQGAPNLPVAEIGDPAKGAQLWNEKRCSDCHQLAGVGGTDAPPLDFMRQHLSAREIADMAGQIWNHLPQMLPHFEDEGIPVPTFETGQMADLIAFLHGGTGAAPPTTGAMSETGAMTETGTATETAPPMTGTAATETGMAAGGGDPAKGKEVFAAQGCGACHAFAAAGATATVGPNLDDTLKGKDAAFVEQGIVDPNAVIAPGFQPDIMPQSYGQMLTQEQIADLVAFLLQSP